MRTIPKLLRRDRRHQEIDFCALCGHTFGPRSFDRTGPWYRRCSWCGAGWSQWTFLRKLAKTDGPITLVTLCGWSNTGKCRGSQKTVPAEALRQATGVGGNGPSWYLLATRHAIQTRCGCGNYYFSTDLLRANRARLLRFYERRCTA